jgi:hypothetical protein
MHIIPRAPKTYFGEVAFTAVTCSWNPANLRRRTSRPFGLGMLLLGCLAVDASWAQGELSFTRRDFGVGDGPFSVTAGDFNGDGQQDLATANFFAYTVSILLGNGDGAFERARDVGVGAVPTSVTVGDFDNDGRQDLATANSAADTVSILMGNGDGAFEPGQEFRVGRGPRSVIVGDFNGDSQQDLATANSADETVSVLLGNGDGAFEPARDFEVGTGEGNSPLSITVGDFNGDSQQDLAAAYDKSACTFPCRDFVSILLGNGDGAFDPAQDFEVGEAPFSVTTGDFNGDGQQDLATANNADDAVSILLGNGDGAFKPAQDVGVGGVVTSVTVGDFDDDGRQDLATARAGVNIVSILLGNGDGALEPARDFGVGENPFSITVGDFNGDGQQDVATANLNADSVSILINNTGVELTVMIDIKPGAFPNSINTKSKGLIPVAVLTTDTFDASAVDATTVFFGANGSEAAPAHSALEDVDGDGNTDMILHFRAQETGIVCGNTSASLTGSTFSGQAIKGSDSIRTVRCK